MATPTLVIGNKNYSSWSLRAWLYLKLNDISFDEVRLPLSTSNFQNEIGQYSPSRLVPVLIDGENKVWDSLAIIEYVRRHYPTSVAWPAARSDEAAALSAAMEMHSGFGALRSHYPMNCRLEPFAAPLLQGVETDIARLDQLWSERLETSAGPGLFGEWSIADVVFAPVAFRIQTYRLPFSPPSQAYVERLLQLPPMVEWLAAARAETEILPAGEWAGFR
ncbi:glutathione S-transferase family protein [Exilibacterium tricleocarpae]|uniref:Glutathione S-transferase family protein n=1 Tax=Exilibacterium tricleocarpae TaxID=2591008 RepID=A0A545U3N6_9GAMM|nr:glutathione S-transferase family protein [Exilibacterium tricleocarpae]TQV84090.1 glutathione S-transferase family protein [Exilibacterium tricleocarpae]